MFIWIDSKSSIIMVRVMRRRKKKNKRMMVVMMNKIWRHKSPHISTSFFKLQCLPWKWGLLNSSGECRGGGRYHWHSHMGGTFLFTAGGHERCLYIICNHWKPLSCNAGEPMRWLPKVFLSKLLHLSFTNESFRMSISHSSLLCIFLKPTWQSSFFIPIFSHRLLCASPLDVAWKSHSMPYRPDPFWSYLCMLVRQFGCCIRAVLGL